MQGPPPHSSYDKLVCKTIKYNEPININSKTLTEVYHYSVDFTTNKKYKMVTVRLCIPFTGNSGGVGARSRILLYLDKEMICDGSIHNGTSYDLKPLHLYGEVFDLPPGKHSVKLMCSTAGGILTIPHYDSRYIDHTDKPEISGKVTILGFE